MVKKVYKTSLKDNSDTKTSYDNLIMSWSCFGDFVLVAHSMHTLIKGGYIKRGVIISHELSLKNILSQDENIIVLYPTKNIIDFFTLLKMSLDKNIFVLHDMPSYNRFTKEIRLLMSLVLTFRPSSKSILLLDQNFKENITTKISKILLSHSLLFDKRIKTHISQYILDILASVNIFNNQSKIICDYDLKLNEKEYSLENIFIDKKLKEHDKKNSEKENILNTKPKNKYIAIHPFASSEAKGQIMSWWVASIKNINTNYPDLNIVIIGSKKNYPNGEIIRNSCTNIYNMCGVTNFRETLYIIKNSALSINVDSGPAHYAACYLKPQILIWSKDDNYAYMPTNNKNATFIFGENIIESKDVYIKDVKFDQSPDTASIFSLLKNKIK